MSRAGRTLSERYAPDKEVPLGGYAALLGTFSAFAGASLWALSRRERSMAAAPSAGDLALLGVATHKLTRIITQDWVTSPLRAPFVEYQGPRPGGEVSENPTGHGLRRAMGDLLTCAFCAGPWVAGGLVFSHAVAPRGTKRAASVFAVVTVSDFLHRIYKWLGAKADR